MRLFEIAKGSFEEWFQGSKVVDAQGRPRKVYHGSTVANLKDFDMRFVGSGVVGVNRAKGIFFTSSYDNAAYFADPMEITGGHEEIPKDNIIVYGEGPYFVLIEEDEHNPLMNFGAFSSEKEAQAAAEEVIRRNNELHDRGKTGVVYRTTVDDHIVEAYLRITNPLVVDGIGAPEAAVRGRKGGYDGATITNTRDGSHLSDIHVVFDPSQVWAV